MVDAGLRIIAANHSFSSLADISIEELSVLPLASLLSNSPSPLTELFGHRSTTFGAVLACRNGRAIPVRCSCSRVHVDEHVCCLLQVRQTETLEITAVAQQSELLFTILDTAPIGLFFLAGRTLQWYNKRFSAMLGYTPDTLPQDHVRSLFVDDFNFTQASQLLGQLSSGERSFPNRSPDAPQRRQRV